MRSRRTITLSFLGSLLVLAGCAIFAGKGEYAAYRSVRTAPDESTRLLAEQRYVAVHPHGAWSTEVQAHRRAVEGEVWNTSKTTREGLAFYLEAFPDAPHVTQARARLAALQSVQGHREDEAARRRAVEDERRRVREEQRRTWATRAVSFWMRTMLGVTNWGSSIQQIAPANPGFASAFGEAPAPHCSQTAGECDKFYSNHYAIPVPGATRVERSLSIVLRLKMPGGNLDRVEFLMAGKGFSRWYEMENRTIVTDEDPEQRQQAIDWVVAKVTPAITELLANANDIQNPSFEPIAPLAFSVNGASTGTGTPGSGATAPDDDDDEQAPPPAATPDAGVRPTAAPDAGAAQPDAASAEFDQLMRNAAGGNEPTPAPQTQQVEEVVVNIVPEDAGPLLPRVVRAVQTPALRVFVFVANDEDYGTAYDGIIIERNRPRAATPPVRPGGRPPVRPGPARPPARPRPAPAPH